MALFTRCIVTDNRVMNKSILLVLLLFVSLTAKASDWTVNKDHSEVFFQVPYLTVSNLTGRFNEFQGEVVMTDALEITGVGVKIEAASIDTGNKLRDGHLKGSDFFQSQEYPHIIFKSQKVILLKPNLYKAIGELTLKNITKPFSIEFTTTKSVKDTWGYENIFVKFTSKLNRKDFKMNWNKTLDDQKYLVGDEISFWGTFQIQPKLAKTPNSKHMIPDTEYIRGREEENRKKDQVEEESSFSKKFRKLINRE